MFDKKGLITQTLETAEPLRNLNVYGLVLVVILLLIIAPFAVYIWKEVRKIGKGDHHNGHVRKIVHEENKTLHHRIDRTNENIHKLMEAQSKTQSDVSYIKGRLENVSQKA